MIHPIYVSTHETPATRSPLPLKLTLTFGDPALLPEYMRGDMRIQLLIDGIPSGLKFFREEKLRGKGFVVEFSGYRVGRTEERGFVLNPVPEEGKRRGGVGAGVVENTGLEWLREALEGGQAAPEKGEYPALGCVPDKPPVLPRGVSVVQVLVTVGKKFRTLEKYFMAGARVTTAFYYAPRPPVGEAMERGSWRAPVGAVVRREEEEREDGESVLGGRGGWRPVGLAGVVTKTAQHKEVEFAGRLHLLRFWCFVGGFFFLVPQGRGVLIDGCGSYAAGDGA